MILLRAAWRWIATRAIWFVLIVVVLAAGTYLVNEVRRDAANASRLSEIQQAKQRLENFTGAETARITRSTRELRQAPARVLNARLVEIEQEIATLQERSAWGIVNAPFDALSARVRLELLQQQREYLYKLLLVAQATEGLKAANRRLVQMKQEHRAIYERLQANKQRQRIVIDAHPVAAQLPWSRPGLLLTRFRSEYATLFDRNQAAARSVERQMRLIAQLRRPGEPAEFAVDRLPIQPWFEELDRQVAPLQAWRDSHWLRKVTKPLRDVVPWALGILVSLIVIPPLIRTFFYFVLAPVAARRPPIALLATDPGSVAALQNSTNLDPASAAASGISRAITIDETQELLVNPEYLQSVSLKSEKDTKWLLDWQYPISSLASGLFALTRIRSSSPETIVISDKKDPLNEVGQIVVPAGIALAFQPSNLVGLVQSHGQPLRITRHWRLGSLTAWLTFQLRYLVFHGPATLLVKGCRGIRIEQAGNGRSIDQSATIGFCAHLAHNVTRCETFPPYLFGKHSLFDDLFSGGPGFYVYEEVPDLGKRTGIAGRGLEGIMDSLLKLFGI
ncbi:MAG: hypothetical protein ACREVI_15210 [Steroidobacteraceae bacterium]